MRPFRKVLQGTCYELEDHTVCVEITQQFYEKLKSLLFLLEGRDVKATILSDYPKVVIEGWAPDNKVTDDEVFEMKSDVRIDYSELHLWHDGDLLWRYGCKHVDGRHWEAAWVTWDELETHFKEKA